MTRLFRPLDIPPLWLAVFAGLAWAQGRWAPLGAAGAPGRGFGAVLIGVGIAVTALAAWQFARHRTTIIPGQTPTTLVDTGLYRLSRNPIYVADALILAGLCLWWGAVSGLFLVPAFIWLIQKRFIDWEERRLRREFGPEFDRYAARVRRWI